MFKEMCSRNFKNGVVYALKTKDDYPIEVTDTFLPFYTKDAIGRKQNTLYNNDLGSRKERWMVGVSTMSGCPVGCKFCATGNLKKCRNLTAEEIVEQVMFVVDKNLKTPFTFNSKEFKINYTRMGEPFLNVGELKKAIKFIDESFPATKVHHYVSTIGVKGADYSWIKDNITLQFSIHSFDEKYRDWLIPYKNKATLEELGKVRTKSGLKTTLNLTLARKEDFSIKELQRLFDPEYFFIKLSPINTNKVSEANNMGAGVIKTVNLI